MIAFEYSFCALDALHENVALHGHAERFFEFDLDGVQLLIKIIGNGFCRYFACVIYVDIIADLCARFYAGIFICLLFSSLCNIILLQCDLQA